MLGQGKCPYCEKPLSTVAATGVDVVVGLEHRWKGVTYACPYCQKILGVEIDPIALKADIVAQIKKR